MAPWRGRERDGLSSAASGGRSPGERKTSFSLSRARSIALSPAPPAEGSARLQGSKTNEKNKRKTTYVAPWLLSLFRVGIKRK